MSQQSQTNSRHPRLAFDRSAMVLFALEQSLGEYVRENVTSLDAFPTKQVQRDLRTPPTVESLIQGTYISEILDLAIAAAGQSSDCSHLRKLKELADALELYEIRNAVAHPNRPFPDCYWFRLAAIASDPVIDVLGFQLVRQSLEAAIENRISLPPDDWFSVYAFQLLNNLPKSLEHEITGLLGREKEKADLAKKLKSKRIPLIAVVGPGGTGKTAIVLDVLRDFVFDPKSLEWVDEVVFVTAKTERLTKDGAVSIENPISSIDAVKQSISDVLRISHEFGGATSFDVLIQQLGTKRILVCIDNLETLLRDHASVFDDFYSAMPSDCEWRFIVTSRIPVDGAQTQVLPAMSTAAATALAQSYATKRGGKSLPKELAELLVEKSENKVLPGIAWVGENSP